MSPKKWRNFSLFIFSFLILPSLSLADEIANYTPSTNMMGELGLNTIPSARMSPEGSARLTLSRQSDYTHASLGVQLTNRFYLGLRQTSESKTINSETLHLYPGIDAKLMLYRESRFIPQISAGIQSALGHKRMAGEYLALSKRYEDFDFTLGLGWGRMGSRMSLPNPILTNAFQDSSRKLDGDNPNSPKNWFKGDIGIFGGIEYATAINGLSIKADWNSDAWKAEKTSELNFKAPKPWSIGMSYRPIEWVDTGMAYDGRDIMARITFNGDFSKWKYDAAPQMPFMGLKKNRPEPTPFNNDDNNDDSEDDYHYSINTEHSLGLTNIFVTNRIVEANISLDENIPTPEQIGNAARYLSNISGPSPEKIILHLTHNGIKGISLSLNRSDLERLFVKNYGSVEEIWQNAEFLYDTKKKPLGQKLSEIISVKPTSKFKLTLQNDTSLAEEDSGFLYRSGITLGYIEKFKRHFVSYQSLRLNLADNLEKLNEYRGVSLLPVRGDIDNFTQNRLMLERSYYAGYATLLNDIHVSSSFGYLEEMYAGLAGEILYRPFNTNWAVGVDTALALKRDPNSVSALALNGDHILTGFINAYYEPFNTGLTMKASAGRFLAGDVGGVISISNEFLNGIKLGASFSVSNKSDPDIYGSKTNIYSGIKLSLPIGSSAYLPNGTEMVVNAYPLGRDTSQRLDMPGTLYDSTEPLSYRHITRHWSNLSGVSRY